MIYMMNQEAVE